MKKPHHLSDKTFIRQTGGGYEILPRGLNIVWGADGRYWSLPEDAPATLTQVSWLDVSGCVEVNPGTYRVRFEVKLKPDAFGWNNSPVLVMAKLGKKGSYQYKEVNLTSVSDDDGWIPRDDVTITVPSGSPERKLYFGLYEVWSGKWKGGLQISKAVVEQLN